MMTINLYTQAGRYVIGGVLPDALTYSLGVERGLCSDLQATLSGDAARSVRVGQRIGVQDGAALRWAGSVVEVGAGGLIGACGDWLALEKDVYGAADYGVWRADNTLKQGWDGWQVVADAQGSDRYSYDNNNRLFMSIKKDAQYNAGDLGAWRYDLPGKMGGGAKLLIFDYKLYAPAGAGWSMVVTRSDGTIIWQLAANGSVQQGRARALSNTPVSSWTIGLLQSSGVKNTAEDGTYYARATSVQMFSASDATSHHVRELALDMVAELAARADAHITADTAAITASRGLAGMTLAGQPIAYWRLNDTTTTMKDATGNGHDGTFTGTYTQGQAALIEGDEGAASTLFGGGYAVVPSSAAFNVGSEMTWFVWLNLTDLSDSRVMIGRGDGWKFDMEGTKFRLTHPKVAEIVATAATTGRHSLVITKSGSSYVLYLDGVQKATASYGGTLDNSGPIYVGANDEGGIGRPILGYMEEAGLAGRAWPAAEVAAWHAAGIRSGNPGIIPAIWRGRSYLDVLAQMAALGDGADVPARYVFGVEPTGGRGQRGLARLYYRAWGGVRYIIDSRDALELRPTASIRSTPTASITDYQDYSGARQLTAVATAAQPSPISRLLYRSEGQLAAATAEATNKLALRDATQSAGVGSLRISYPVYDKQAGRHVSPLDILPGYFAMLPTREARQIVASGSEPDGWHVFGVAGLRVDAISRSVELEPLKDGDRLARYRGDM